MSFASLFKDDFGKSDYYGKGIIVDKDLGLALRDNLKQYINKVLTTSPRKDIIFSSENVFHFETHEMERMIEFFKTYTKNIIIIAYVREPIEWACSYFSEFMKHGLIGQTPYNFELKKKLSKFCELVGKINVIVRCFSSVKKKGRFWGFCSPHALRYEFENNKRKVGATANAARVLLRLVKIRENYSRANFIAFRSFLRINEFIISSFAKDAPLDPNYFSCFADYSDNEYLKEEFGIEYKRPEEMHSIDSFFRYLTNLDSISTDSKFFTEIVIPMPVTLKLS